MDYGRLISDAWRLAWSRRYLWILGLLVPSGASSCSSGSNFNYPTGRGAPGPLNDFGSGAAVAAQSFVQWAAANLGAVIAIGVVLLVLILALIALRVIFEGGMAYATVQLARGQESSFGSAWRAGLRLGWRYFGLGLLLFAVTLLAVALIAVLVFAAVAIGRGLDRSGIALLILGGGLLTLIVLVILIPLAIAIGILVNYALRAIAASDVGPIRALRIGYQLLRARLGTSLVVWLVSVGLGIGVAIALTILSLIVLAIFGGIGLGIYSAAGWGPAMLVYVIVAVLLTILILWPPSAVASAFIWSYWSLAYIRLTETELLPPEPDPVAD